MNARTLAVCLLGAGCASAPPPSSTANAVESPAPAPAVKQARLPMPSPLNITPKARSPKTSKFTLPNGMRVVIVEHHARPIVSIRLNFRHGSLSDKSRVAGATYMAVSLLGDLYERDDGDQRIVGEKSLRRQVLEAGGLYRDYVGWDSSGIGVDGYSVDVAKYLSLLGAAVEEPRHGEAMFEVRQRSAIHALEDIEIQDPSSYNDQLKRAAFGENHPYGRSVTGSVKTLKRMALGDVINQQRRIVRPQGATLLIVGDVDSQRVLRWAENAFRPFRGQGRAGRVKARPSKLAKTKPVVIPRRGARSFGLCAARALPDVEADDATLQLLVTWLGDGLSSPLMGSLRLKHGLSYSSSAWLIKRRQGRALLVCTQVRPQHAEQATGLLLGALAEAAAAPPTEEQLDRARAMVAAKDLGRHRSVAASTANWLERLSLDEAETSPATASRVTPQDVHRLAQKILSKEYLRIVYSGDLSSARAAARTNELGALRILR